MTGCLFCKVASGEIAATVVKRADGLLAFQDINPQAPTHLRVIPTLHIASPNDATDDTLLGRMLGFARDLAREVGIAERGFRTVVNTNAYAGQMVFHLYLHLRGGRAMRRPPG